jgi:hypothetical protein
MRCWNGRICHAQQADGHAFDPVTHVCAKCEITRKQFLDAGKPKCSGRPSEAERFLIDGEPDSKGG